MLLFLAYNTGRNFHCLPPSDLIHKRNRSGVRGRDLPHLLCYNRILGPLTNPMRIASPLLAILTIAALLAPVVYWASSPVGINDCACPPVACMCPGHQHAMGHRGKCAMANGGQCGLHSSDYVLSSLLTSLTYIPSEHRFPILQERWGFGYELSNPSLQPSHAQPPDQPPRLAA